MIGYITRKNIYLHNMTVNIRKGLVINIIRTALRYIGSFLI